MAMKYSIRPNHQGDKLMIFEDGVQGYYPDAAHLEFWRRIQDLEECLAEIYHHTSCTTHQMELINKILPQE